MSRGRAAAGADHQRVHGVVDDDALVGADAFEQPAHGLRGQQPERVVVGARPDGRQHLLRLGGGEHEDQVFRRLLDDLEQRVEACRGDHVRFVDDEDAVARLRGRVERPVAQFAGVVDAAVAGGVEFGDVDAAGPLGASATQESHTPHGVGVGPCSQFSERARMRADDVLPQPRGPENRYAWLIRPAVSAVDSGSVTCSWPTTSAKEAGRYLR